MNVQLEKEVSFSPATGRYVRLVALSEANSGGPWTAMAELNILGTADSDVLAISPSTAAVVVNGQQDFDGVGGLPPYTYEVVADTTGGGSVNSEGLYTAGPNPGSSTVRVTDMNSDTADAIVTVTEVIPQTGWSLLYVDSEELIGTYKPAVYTFDGDPTTIWHTEWYESDPPHPHEIQIDLGGIFDIDGFRYLPRQNRSNGRIKDYEFYVSLDGVDWGSPVATGTFPNTTAEQPSHWHLHSSHG